MSRGFYSSLLLIAVALCTSCASSYKAITFEKLPETDTVGMVIVSYDQSVLKSVHNGKYHRRARRQDIQVVAIQIKNLGDEDLKIGEHLTFTVDGDTAKFLDSRIFYRKTKQSEAIHFLHLLWLGAFVADDDVVYWPGPLLALPLFGYNLATANYANWKYKKDVNRMNLAGTSVGARQQVSGVLAYRSRTRGQLLITQ